MAWLGRSDKPATRASDSWPITPTELRGSLRTRRGPCNISATDSREFLENAQAIGDSLGSRLNGAVWQIFRQARARCFRSSQDSKAARQSFYDQLQSCWEIHTRSTRSSPNFAEHARGASGFLKTRSRPGNFSATGRRAAEEYTSSRRARAVFSPSTPAELQVFSRREVGPATFLRLAAELLKNARPRRRSQRAPSVFSLVRLLALHFFSRRRHLVLVFFRPRQRR